MSTLLRVRRRLDLIHAQMATGPNPLLGERAQAVHRQERPS